MADSGGKKEALKYSLFVRLWQILYEAAAIVNPSGLRVSRSPFAARHGGFIV